MDRAIVGRCSPIGDCRRSVVHFLFLSVLAISGATGLMAPRNVFAAEGSSEAYQGRMARAWDSVYESHHIQVEPGAEVPRVLTSHRGTRWDSFLDYVTAQMGSEYVYNWIDFSGKPTVSFVNPNTPNAQPVFEDDDHKFNWYGSVGTVGAGHSRLNTYFSGVYRRDLDEHRDGSPFFSILNGFSGGDKGNLLNGWAEMNGLAESGFFSNTKARLGRVFIPYTFPGVIGSPAIDGSRLSYDDTRNEVNGFAGRWEPFYDGVSSEVVIAGGSVSRQLLQKWGPEYGIAPYAQLLYFDDTGQSDTSVNHIYGFRSWWEMITLDTFFAWVEDDPVDLGAQATFTQGKMNMYGKIHKKLTTDDYVYDVFLTAEDLKDARRLNIGDREKWLDVTFDADYQLLKWLSVGAGVWARALDDEDDQAAYQNSFTDVNGRILLTPCADLNTGVQYRYRDVRRRNPRNATTFDDISRAGETEYHEVNGEVRYRYDLWRFNVGGYLGIFDTQNRLTKIDNTMVAGGYAQTKAYLTETFALRFLFIVDRGNDQFTPDIDTQYSFRSGFEYYY